MKTLLETAIEAGVPLPETCKNLDRNFWLNKVSMYWFFEDNRWSLCTRLQKLTQERYFVAECFNVNSENKERCIENVIFIPAPQMHQIAPIIENLAIETYSVKMVNLKFDFTEQGLDKIQHLLCFENDNISENAIYININNNHYAQSYAELYLLLREKGLLETKN